MYFRGASAAGVGDLPPARRKGARALPCADRRTGTAGAAEQTDVQALYGIVPPLHDRLLRVAAGRSALLDRPGGGGAQLSAHGSGRRGAGRGLRSVRLPDPKKQIRIVTELEKILAGGLYDFSDAELAEQFREGRRRVERFNRTPVDDAAAYAAALGALIPGIPASAKVVQPFYCDLGWRIELGEEVKYGIFYRFCQKAANHPDKDYFFIIDEINRGNMSKIFGELLMLIEADYRDKKATLAYNGLSFSVPKRLHIIGMMNTADRSLAMIDYALRRRFSFFDMEPGFDSEGFINYQNSFANETFNTLIERIKELNKEIAQDKALGKGFCIGHSYFCNANDCAEEWMKDVVDFDILPMLSEYWFDESSKLQRWENILHGVFQ